MAKVSDQANVVDSTLKAGVDRSTQGFFSNHQTDKTWQDDSNWSANTQLESAWLAQNTQSGSFYWSYYKDGYHVIYWH